MSDWTLFSNHGHVLVCLARDPDARLRDVAAAVGITERAVQKIVRDLQQGGMLSVSKQGRRNQYRIHRKVGLRHALESGSNVGGLVDFVGGAGRSQSASKPKAETVKASSAPVQPPVNVEAKSQAEAAKKEAAKKKADKQLAEKLAADKRAADKKAAEKMEADKREAETKAAEKAAADKEAARIKAAKKEAADTAKAEAKREAEKQQGSLF